MPWFRLVPSLFSWLAVAAPVGAASRSDLVRDDLATAALLTAVAGWLVFALLRGSWGGARADRSPADADDAELDLPDDPPPVVDALVNNGVVRPHVIATVVLDLASRGYIGIVEDRRGAALGRAADASSAPAEWRLVRLDTPRGDLHPYENAVFTRLFASGNETSRHALAGWVTANRQQARVFVERVQRAIGGEVQRRGYVESGRRLPLLVNLCTGGVVVLVGLGALVSGAWAGLLALGSGAGQVAATRRLRRRTVSGTDRIREWTSVRRRLERLGADTTGDDQGDGAERDDGEAGATEPGTGETGTGDAGAHETGAGDADADERGVPVSSGGASRGDLGRWERALVYAAVLGVADEFARGLVERHPEVAGSDGFVRWFRTSLGADARISGAGRFVDEFGRVFADAAGLDPVREIRSRASR